MSRTRALVVILALVVSSLPSVAAADAAFDIVVLGGRAAVSDAVVQQLAQTTSGEVRRVSGDDRFATAAALSAVAFDPGVPVAYVATGIDFPDALAAGPLAAIEGGPILLVTRSGVPEPTATELARLAPERIVVAGGAGVIGDSVLAELARFTDGAVERRAGPDRFATAAALSAAGFAPGVPAAFVATGNDFPDALAGVSLAAARGAPILLTGRDTVPGATAAELQRLRPGEVFVLGGRGVISEAVRGQLASLTGAGVTRLSGQDRFATAAAISHTLNGSSSPSTVLVATGLGFADALAGGPVAASLAAPLLLATSATLPAATITELNRLAGVAPVVPPRRLEVLASGAFERSRGVATDPAGQFYVSHDTVAAIRVSRFSPAGEPAGAIDLGGFFDVQALGRLERDPVTGEIWLLTQDGRLIALQPDLSGGRLVASLRQAGIVATSFHDLSTGTVGTMGGVVQPQFATYGDLAIRALGGNRRQVFVTGAYAGFPFVARLVMQGDAIEDARVISSSRTQSVEESGPRGVAVSPQGIVLTTLPLPNTDNRITFTPTGNLDVLVAMAAGYVPGAAAGAPQVVLPRQAVVSSRGMTADADGRFYVATSAIGVTAPGRVQSTGGALLVLPPQLDTITAIGEVEQSLISDFQDVAVDRARRRAYVTVNGVGGLAPDRFAVFGLP